MSGNQATGGDAQGGGVFNAGSLTGDRSVVERNVATAAAAAGGGVFNSAGTAVFNRSIVRNNQPDNCSPPGSVPGCIN